MQSVANGYVAPTTRPPSDGNENAAFSDRDPTPDVDPATQHENGHEPMDVDPEPAAAGNDTGMANVDSGDLKNAVVPETDAPSGMDAMDVVNPVEGADRRRSGRVRHVPKEFVPEPIKPKAPRSSKPKKKAEQKPTLIAKVRYLNISPRPEFSPIQLDCSKDIFWLRLNLREFLLRFDKLCRLPTRHATTINDPLQPWNDYLYKATIVALFRLIENDNTPIFEYAKYYLAEIEHTPAESPRLWELMYEFLEQSDPYLNAADELSGEHYRLELIRRLMVLATGTETIRITILNDHEQLRQLQLGQGDKIKAINTHLTESMKKLEKLKSTDKQLYFDRVAAAERTATDKRFRAQQTLHSQTHKYTLRTIPLGEDIEGNLYWSFQQKSKDIPSWGTWIVCELVWPTEMVEKRSKATKQQVGQLFKKKKVPKEKEPVKLTLSASAFDQTKAPDQPETKPEPVKKEENPKPKPEKKRKPPTPPKSKTLYYVEGKENIAALAEWIKGQPGHQNEKLVTDLESISLYLQE